MGQQIVALAEATFLNLASIYAHKWAPELHENLREIRQRLENTNDRYRRCFDPIITRREATAAWLTDLNHDLDTLQHVWLTEDYQRGTKLHPDAGDVIKHLRVWLRLDENPDLARRDERLKAVVGEGGKLLDTVQSYFGISASPEIPICLKNAIEGLGQVADDISETLDQIQQPHVDAAAPSIQDLKTTLSLVGSFINKANEK